MWPYMKYFQILVSYVIFSVWDIFMFPNSNIIYRIEKKQELSYAVLFSPKMP